MLMFDRHNWNKHHRTWFVFVSLVTLATMTWYGVAGFLKSRLLGGGSLPGFTFGVIGGLICLFEFLLWPRSRLSGLRY